MKNKLSSFLLTGIVSFGVAFGSLSFVKNHQETAQIAFAADYYSTISDGDEGNTLKTKLNKIIDTSNVDVDYDWYRYEEADEDPNNKNNIITIYARTSLAKDDHVKSGNIGWNREHTFPQSKLSNAKSKNDNHIVYASDAKVNGARGNLKMGELSGGTKVVDSYGHTTDCYVGSGLFDPKNESRGIVARSTMYAAVMYGFTPTENFESMSTLLKWHLENLPSDNDLRRNDVVYKNQHNRNPFVDHPEYACRIWGTSGEGKTVCSQYTQKGIEIYDGNNVASDLFMNVSESKAFTARVDGTKVSDATWELTKLDGTSYVNDNVTLSVADGVATVTITKADYVYLKASYSYDNDGVEATITKKIKISTRELSSISLNNPKTEYRINEAFAKPTVNANYNDGSTKNVTNEATFDLGGFDSSVVGEYTIGVSYENKSTSYKVSVKNKPAPANNGCGGNIATTSALLSGLAALGIAIIIISIFTRNKNKKA